MAAKRGGSGRKGSSGTPPRGKVGSDRAARVSGKGDFGIPASKARKPILEGGREKGPEQGIGPMRSGNRAVRESGVGYPPGPPGSGSGGDIDPDIVGVNGTGGVAASPPSGRTRGPDITEGGSAPFASGPPAEGKDELPPGTHGAARRVRGSTIDHSGGDATTTGTD